MPTLVPFPKSKGEVERGSSYCPIATRFPTPQKAPSDEMSDEEKIAYIATRFGEIMDALGLDREDPSLEKTPERIAKMYVQEIFSGLDEKNFPKMSFFPNEYRYNEKGNMVFVKTQLMTFCEHHFVPVQGTAYVAYVPNEKLIGLSKIPRIVRFFARRPQLQERLTVQVADSIRSLLETEHVAVSITAQHFCVMARGVEDCDSVTTTNALFGDFDTSEPLKNEFFDSIQRKCSHR